MELVDWLDDLCVRFIINLPQEELVQVERICFQVEEAQWFYEDFIRPLDPALPSLNLRQFSLLMFQHCPLLSSYSEHHHLAAFEEFLTYKTRVPVRGAIMLNSTMDEVVLVKGWKKGANWSFPRGKINKDERDLDCAVREVYEETGFDLVAAGLVPETHKVKYIEVTMREQHMRLYVFRGIPQDTVFQPRTRKEISKIQWYKLTSLPGYRKNKHAAYDDDTLNANKLYMVAPFMSSLRKWVNQQRKIENQCSSTDHLNTTNIPGGMMTDDYLTDEYAQQGQPKVPTFAQNNTQWNTDHDFQFNDSTQFRALAGLNKGEPSTDEASAQLKQLLSVGQLSTANIHPMPAVVPSGANSANLLALLRQGSTPTIGAPQQPKTLFEQITTSTQEPETPHYHHARPPSLSNIGPPPAFPYSPSQLAKHDSQKYQSMSATDRGAQPLNRDLLSLFSTSNQSRHIDQGDSSYPIDATLDNPSLPQRSTNEPGTNLLHALQDYGPDRDRSTGNAPPSGTSSAFNPPIPNLSNHHMNLLSAFKTMKKPDVVQDQSTAGVYGSRLGQLFDGKGSVTPAFVASRPSNNSERQPSAPPSSISSLNKAQVENDKVNKGAGTLTRQPTSQQTALLDLFRSPTKAPIALATDRESQRLSTPTDRIELPTARSPVPASQAKSKLYETKVERTAHSPKAPKSPKISRSPKTPKSPKAPRSPKVPRSPTVPQSPRFPGSPSHRAKSSSIQKPVSPHLPSATLSGPHNLPELGSIRHKRQHNKGNRSSSNAKHSDQASKSPQAPIQILKRPTSLTAPDSTSPTVVASAIPSPKEVVEKPAGKNSPTQATVSKRGGSKKVTKAETAKTFQPQILRRPQPSGNVEATRPENSVKAALATAPALQVSESRPTSTKYVETATAPALIAQRKASGAPVDHKQTLLSLFGQAKTSAASAVSAVPLRSPPAIDNNINNSPISMSPTSLLPASIIGIGSKPLSAPIMPKSGGNSSNASSIDGRASLTGPMAVVPPRTQSRMSSMASSSRDKSRRGSQTPISPSDRGFLLSYLDGVVKNAAASSSSSATIATTQKS